MEINRELERIHDLGYEVTVTWNGYIHISGTDKPDEPQMEFFVLMYTYYKNDTFTFEQALIETINIFYSWLYNYEQSGNFVGMGNIDNMIDRHFKIKTVIN